MTAAVGVLCARVRVEEKQVIAALAGAGVPARPLPPATSPLPIGPRTPAAGDSVIDELPHVVLDRCPNRVVAAAILPVWRAAGIAVIHGGLAATGDRLAVATALAAAGLRRPATRLVCSDEAALAALDEIGYPATLFPLTPGTTPALLFDRDTAEAVLEHRIVLGSRHETVALVQAGTATEHDHLTIIVVDGHAVAVDANDAGDVTMAARLAEETARALDAAIAGVAIALTPAGPIVWDVQPVPEFRAAASLGQASVADATAQLLVRHLGLAPADIERVVDAVIHRSVGGSQEYPLDAGRLREVSDGVALSA